MDAFIRGWPSIATGLVPLAYVTAICFMWALYHTERIFPHCCKPLLIYERKKWGNQQLVLAGSESRGIKGAAEISETIQKLA